MEKTDAERERKNPEMWSSYLEKEKKKTYVETGEVSTKDFKQWSKVVKIGVQKYRQSIEKMK